MSPVRKKIAAGGAARLIAPPIVHPSVMVNGLVVSCNGNPLILLCEWYAVVDPIDTWQSIESSDTTRER